MFEPSGSAHRLINRFGMVGTVVIGTLMAAVLSDAITVMAALLVNPEHLWFGVALATICPIVIAPMIIYVILRLLFQLQGAMEEIHTLSGLLPICSYCRKIRDDDGQWGSLEHYVTEHSDALFSHGVCPECKKREFDPYLKRTSSDGE